MREGTENRGPDTPEAPAWADPALTVDEDGRTTYARGPQIGPFESDVDPYLVHEAGETTIQIGPSIDLPLHDAERLAAALIELVALGRGQSPES